MDHLLVASNGSLTEHDLVPYVATDNYIGIPFTGYLKHTDQEDLLDTLIPPTHDRSLDQLASLLQTWLVFCLLQNVLGSYFEPEEYVEERLQKDGTTKIFLSTRNLTAAVLRCNQDTATLPLPGAEVQEMMRQLEIARVQMPKQRRLRVFTVSALAIMAILPSLRTVEMDEPALSISFSNTIPEIDLHLMRKQGWCPFDAITQWNRSRCVETRTLLRTSRRDDGRNHGTCTTASCCYNNNDAQSKAAKHTDSQCKCEMFEVDAMLAEEVIGSGNTLLLHAHQKSSRDRWDLKMMPHSATTQYVAISHLWTDGMGNPNGNSLPICQLERVADKVRALSLGQKHSDSPIDVWLWLDTLCCPAKSARLKKLSLSSMADVYRNASNVLVLDACLQRMESEKMQLIEIVCHIAYSKWMLRLWTFQEGSLCKRLHFQFADRAIDWVELPDLWAMNNEPGKWRLAHDCYRRLMHLRMYFDWHPDGGHPFHYIYESVESRNFSVATDEGVCLMTMLGQQLKPEATMDPENMAHFWSCCIQQGLIHADQIFQNEPRLSTRGFSWAPRSVKRSELAFYTLVTSSNETRVIPVEQGISVTLPGLLCRNHNQSSLAAMVAGRATGPLADFMGHEMVPTYMYEPKSRQWYRLRFYCEEIDRLRAHQLQSSDFAVVHRTTSGSSDHYQPKHALLTAVVDETLEGIEINRVANCFITEFPPTVNECVQQALLDTQAIVEGVRGLEKPWLELLHYLSVRTDVSPEDAGAVFEMEAEHVRAGRYLKVEALHSQQKWILR